MALSHTLLEPVQALHRRIRDDVVRACEAAAGALADVAREEEGDTIYEIDRVAEHLLVAEVGRTMTADGPVVLVAEGLPGGETVVPEGADRSRAAWVVIVDPIDGTRGLMYQKRSAWVLTGVARNRGPCTNLGDIQLAVQTEIPLVKQHLCDVLWAMPGKGAHAERFNRLTEERQALPLRPSRATTIKHGFAMIARFFPGVRDELAAIDEEIVRGALGPVEPGKAHCFEDQYLSSGGQLYELMMGHDRFVADLRSLTESLMEGRGLALGICCHPYDICTELIAREAGVIVTDELGGRLRALLNVDPDISWAGYANDWIRRQIEPLLHAALRQRGLID